MDNYKLTRDNSVLLLIDQQERLLPAMHNKDQLMKASITMAKMAELFKIPGIVTTQYKDGLGDIDENLKGYGFESIDKISFSAYLNDEFRSTLKDIGRNKVIVTGAESHICVFQTVRDLLNAGYEVYIVADGIGARTEFNYKNGINLMESLGAIITNSEAVLFDIMEYANIPEFKEGQNLIK